MSGPTPDQILRSMRRLHRKNYRQCFRRNVFWDLSVELFHKLTSANCEYCGRPPAQTSRFYTYNGIDRKDHRKGYSKENCVTCCKKCNYVKGATLTYDEMKVVGEALANYRKLHPES